MLGTSSNLLFGIHVEDDKIVSCRLQTIFGDNKHNDATFSINTKRLLNLLHINNGATEHSVQAVFDGDLELNATAYATAPDGSRYPVCTTIQYVNASGSGSGSSQSGGSIMMLPTVEGGGAGTLKLRYFLPGLVLVLLYLTSLAFIFSTLLPSDLEPFSSVTLPALILALTLVVFSRTKYARKFRNY